MQEDLSPNEEDLHVLRGFDDITVYRTQVGFIGIKQNSMYQDEQVIVVPPEVLDRFVDLLRRVKDEILTDKADEAAERAGNDIPPLNG